MATVYHASNSKFGGTTETRYRRRDRHADPLQILLLTLPGKKHIDGLCSSCDRISHWETKKKVRKRAPRCSSAVSPFGERLVGSTGRSTSKKKQPKSRIFHVLSVVKHEKVVVVGTSGIHICFSLGTKGVQCTHYISSKSYCARPPVTTSMPVNDKTLWKSRLIETFTHWYWQRKDLLP